MWNTNWIRLGIGVTIGLVIANLIKIALYLLFGWDITALPKYIN